MKANEILEMKDRLDALEKKVATIERMFKTQIAINDTQAEINNHTRVCLNTARDISKALSEEIVKMKEEK